MELLKLLMKNDFFEWLNNCPVEWYLQKNDDEGREYYFVDDEEDKEK